jgi:hypothetical protein
MTFTLGLILGAMIGGTVGAVVMAFFIVVGGQSLVDRHGRYDQNRKP